MIKIRDKKGITIIYIALIIVMLIGFLGLAIDIGYLYVAKGQLQNAADAAALAGASKINSQLPIQQQYSARNTAQIFAFRNFAAREPVVIASNPNSNELSTITDTGGNDITFGLWSSNRYHEGLTPINAIRVRTRRTVPDQGSPQKQVSTFIGRIFSLLPGGGLGVPFMSPATEAIAIRKPLNTPGLTICINTCPLENTDLFLQKESGDNGIAWTAFSCGQAPNIGKKGDVVEFIHGRPSPQPLCDRCITTNNGVGEALKELDTVFNDPTFDSANKEFNADGSVRKWTVAVPVLDLRCADGFNTNNCLGVACTPPDTPQNPCPSACPPGKQGNINERYHVQQLATMGITEVNTGPFKGVHIDRIVCVGCPTFLPLGQGVALVD